MMKYFFITIGLILISGLTHPQKAECDRIAGAFRTGDVEALADFFPLNLDMTVVETEDVFSKSQAKQILNQFFKKNRPTGYVIKHQGASKNNDYYQVGTLKTERGDFRVTLFIRSDNGDVILKRLRIETNEADF